MADAISIQELIDARTDAKTLEEAVNGDDVTTVLSRLGESYPTLANALSQIDGKLDSADAQIKQGITNLFENGGLPATPFKTKALMTASTLVDGDYAMVTDDTVNNGLYVKTAGAWTKSAYDPLTLAKADATTKAEEAKIAAITASAIDAENKANAAKADAISEGKVYTDSKKTTAEYEYKGNGNLLHKFTPKVVGKAINFSGAVTTNPAHESAVIDVTVGNKLYLANTINATNGSGGSEFAFYTENPFTSTQTKIETTKALVQIAGINYNEVAVPIGAKVLVVVTKFSGVDIGWAIYKNTPSSNFGYGNYEIKSLDGIDVLPKKSRLDGQKVAIFGDELSSSAYVAALTKYTGAVITSYAEAGATSATLADIVAAGSGLARRDATTSNVPRSAIPLTGLSAAIIMIGSNDAPIVSNGDTSVLPTLDIYNSGGSVGGYLNKFPNTYLGNLALAIEYLKYKSPTIEITLVAPPYINKTSNDESVINSLYPAIASLAKFYSVRFADATHSSGLSYKLMAVSSGGYSTDGKNLNATGNELLSKFVALKVTN